MFLGCFGSLFFFVLLCYRGEAFGDALFVGFDLLFIAEAKANWRTGEVVGFAKKAL
ncbi:hypothetical protein D3C85_1781770 [compost metagenome]